MELERVGRGIDDVASSVARGDEVMQEVRREFA